MLFLPRPSLSPAPIAILALIGALLVIPIAPSAAGEEAEVAQSTETSQAEEALDEASAILTPTLATQLFRRALPVPTKVEGTLALRELALSRDDLDAEDRRQANGLLARPTDGSADRFGNGYDVAEAEPLCSPVVCVHYTTTGSQAVSATDKNNNQVPDYVEVTLATVTKVHQVYVEAGYRAPKPDGSRGGDARTDIYLADIGQRGLYGYCTSDEPASTLNKAPWDTWAYCVLDNDYSQAEFPKNTPLQNLQVTAAHEYFHAVQFGYDVAEDPWFLEATATWVEDELFDNVNDNLQYLRSSAMTQPQTPLDTFDGSFPYGTWSFFRFLTETYSNRTGSLPSLVLDLWNQADGATGAPNKYSVQAIETVLSKKGTSLGVMLAKYGAANRKPAYYYDEARANNYPHSKLNGKTFLRPRKRGTPVFSKFLDHLTTATFRIRPATNLRAKNWKLNLTFNMADRAKGSTALIRIRKTSGHLGTKIVRLDARGNGFKQVKFSRSQVKWVEVTLANASTRYQCNQRTQYSCQGQSKDDFLKQKVRGYAVQR